MQTAPSPLESEIAAKHPSAPTNAPTKMSRGVRLRASKELGMDKRKAQCGPESKFAASVLVSGTQLQREQTVRPWPAHRAERCRRWVRSELSVTTH